MISKAVILIVSLTIANVLWAGVVSGDWPAAYERSFFQGAAVVIAASLWS